jgi:hypothetical protein
MVTQSGASSLERDGNRHGHTLHPQHLVCPLYFAFAFASE